MSTGIQVAILIGALLIWLVGIYALEKSNAAVDKTRAAKAERKAKPEGS
jgi:hypothetical protein